MSEYCYQCEKCGEFKEYCKCKQGFQDPMEFWKSQDPRELMIKENDIL